MASELERLLVKIDADVSGLKQGLLVAEGRVKSSASNMRSSFAGLKNSISGVQGAIAAISGAALVGIGASIARMATDALSAADDLQDAADRIGIGTTALQEMRFAADQAGIGAQALDGALAKLSRNQSAAAAGGKKQADAFTALGVAITTASGALIPIEDLIPRIADGLAGMANQQDRLNVASTLFGREAGAKLLNVLQEGAPALDETREKARALGIVIDEGLVQRSAEAADKLDALKMAAGTLWQSALLPLGGQMVELGEDFLFVAKAVDSLVQSFSSLENKSDASLWDEWYDLNKRLNEKTFGIFGHSKQAQDHFRREIDKVQAEITRRGKQRESTKEERERVRAAGGAPTALPKHDNSGKDRANRRTSFFDSLDTEAAAATGSKLAQIDVERAQQIKKAKELAQTEREFADLAERINAIQDEKIRLLFDQSYAADAAKDKTKELADSEQFLAGVIEHGKTDREKLNDQMQQLNEIMAAHPELADEVAKAQASIGVQMEKLTDKADEWKKVMEDAVDSVSSAFSRAFADMLIDGEFTFKRLGDSLLRDFLSQAIEASVVKPAVGFASKALEGALGSVIGGIFGGALAEGGPVSPGRAYLVGERGPELLVPSLAGQIIPMSGSRGGGSDVVVNVINASGAPVQTREQKRGGDARREIQVLIGEAVSGDLARGGTIARSIQATYGLNRRGQVG